MTEHNEQSPERIIADAARQYERYLELTQAALRVTAPRLVPAPSQPVGLVTYGAHWR